MPSDDLKQRIEALNKQPLQNVPEPEQGESNEISALRRKLNKQSAKQSKPAVSSAAPASVPEQITYSRSIPFVSAPPPVSTFVSRGDFGPEIPLEEAIEGVVTEAPAGPGYYHIELNACSLESGAADVFNSFIPVTGHPDGQAIDRLKHTLKADRIAPEDIVFVDLETTGLGLTPVFLIGTMECTQNGFLFKQYFARDYSEEPSILSAFAQRLEEAQLVVTFNGKTFDIPFLKNRATATRLKLPEPKNHLDLLHEARRKYRGVLPNCKLQTLEQYICGRTREDDIPGADIPAAYHEFVRTGNAAKIRLILMHNLYDILTMADLMHRMWNQG